MKINKKLEISLQQLIVEVVGILLLLAFLITFFVLYGNKGEIIYFTDSMYNLQISTIAKSAILVIPIICFIVFVIISFFQFYPAIWNLSKEDEKNKLQNNKILECIKLMISYTKLVFVIIFAYISLMSIQGKLLGKWFIPSAIIIAVLEIAFFIYRFIVLNKKLSADSLKDDNSNNDKLDK